MSRWLSVLLLLGALMAPPLYALESVQGINLQDAAGADGNGGVVDVTGYTSIGLDVTISGTATVNFEAAAFNGGTFRSIGCKLGTSSTPTTTATSSGNYQCNVAGFYQFRTRISGFSAGTVTVKGQLSTGVFAGGGASGGGAASSVASSDTTPATCSPGDVYFDTDATSGQRFEYCDSTDTWLAPITNEADTLTSVIQRGRTDATSNSLANATAIGGTTKVCIYEDATFGPSVRPCTASDVKQLILTNFTGGFYDEENDCWILRIDPDAASPNAAWTFTCTATKPVGVVYWDAGAINVDGTNCTAPTEQALNSAEKTWAFSCGDSNSSIFSGKIRMPKHWDLGTVTFTLSLFHGTTETITFAGDFSAQCRSAGDAINSTYGTAVAADVSITTANLIIEATTSAVTPNATCAAEDWLLWRYVVDAANFSANAANSKVLGVTMKYSKSSLSN